MPHVGGKNAKKKTSSSSDSKRHFTVVIGNKEHGLYVSSSPSSAARKAVSKLCATDKKKKVQFSIREITQGSKKKTYGPYLGSIEKLAKPIELKGRVIRYKPVAKLDNKKKILKGGLFDLNSNDFRTDESSEYIFHSSFIGLNKLFFGKKLEIHEEGRQIKYYFPIVILSDGSFQDISYDDSKNEFEISKYKNRVEKSNWFSEPDNIDLYKDNIPKNEDRFGDIINGLLDRFREEMENKNIPKKYNNINNGNNIINNEQNSWFRERKKINGHDMELGEIYELRPKNTFECLDLYKVIKKDDRKNIIKFAKLKIPRRRDFDVSELRPKILTVRQHMIYGYEYDIQPNRNISVFNEN